MKTFSAASVLLILVLGASFSGLDLKLYVNAHSLILVLGGTIGILGLATPPLELVALGHSFLSIFRGQMRGEELNGQLLLLSRKQNAVLSQAHPLIVYAQQLWEKGIDREMFQALLVKRLHETNNNKVRVVTALRNLAKYPPALGMTGTVIGLVSLFSSLTSENKSQIGPSLAMAMTATFYGLVISNLILMPLADRCQVQHLAAEEQSQHICKILLMIHNQQEESLIRDEVNVRAA
jgi:chemotaxis protein MotA